MSYLIDTHAWLWLIDTTPRLAGPALSLLSDPEVEVVLSAASVWEIAIKHSAGKLPLPQPPEEFVPTRMQRTGVVSLPITATHAARVAALPLHHRDPFDRMLIAQAQIEGLEIITADPRFEAYDVTVIRAG